MTWEKLAAGEDGDDVQELLRKLAFVDPCNIPVGVFADFQLLLPVLEEHCLVQVETGDRETLVSIHALTQGRFSPHPHPHGGHASCA